MGQLGQVLMNLAVNARDAMPSGGSLVLGTEVVTVDQISAEKDPVICAGTFICLSVTDSGTGIDPHVLPHIFEPFFTTKDVGKGTGLGLSTVYGIIKQHQGWVKVSSVLKQGTTFRLYLPVADEASIRVGDPDRTALCQGHHETILVVEDEPALLDLVESVLESHGYQVLRARSGRAALEVWSKHRQQIDLLLTDVVMPDGLSGVDLLHRLRAEVPGLRAILMSGYAATELSLSDHDAFVQKPYRPMTLLKMIHDCLAAAPPVCARPSSFESQSVSLSS